MKLLHRHREDELESEDQNESDRSIPDEAPQPQPEREEPKLAEPTPADLSKRDYVAIVKRASVEVDR